MKVMLFSVGVYYMIHKYQN